MVRFTNPFGISAIIVLFIQKPLKLLRIASFMVELTWETFTVTFFTPEPVSVSEAFKVRSELFAK